MTPNIEEIWKLIAGSGLLDQQQLALARDRLSDSHPSEVCQQLVDDHLITPLHRDVILAGHAGPFIYGRYLITGPLQPNASDPNPWRSFSGKDLRTQHPVQLTFFSGALEDVSAEGLTDDGLAASASDHDAESVRQWRQVEKRVRRLAKCRHRNLLQSYQTILLPDYRFVVSELPFGTRLSEKLPAKGRLKLSESISVALQVAQAIAAQVDAGIDPCLPPEDRLMDIVWVGTKGEQATAKLEADFKCVSKKGTAINSDAAARTVASLLMRMAGGELVSDRNLSKLIQKSGADGELKTILEAILIAPKKEAGDTEPNGVGSARVENKTGDSRDLTALIQTLKGFSGDIVAVPPLETADAFRKVLSGSQLHLTRVSASAEQVPDVDDCNLVSAQKQNDDPRVMAARKSAALRKGARWKTPAAIASALLLMVAALGYWSMSIRTVAVGPTPPPVSPVSPNSDASHRSGGSPQSQNGSGESSGSLESAGKPAAGRGDFSNVAYVQEIIDDDGQRLWESPTNGRSIDFLYVPNSTEILLHIQAASLQRSDAGGRLLKGLTNVFAGATQQLQQSVGVTVDQIETITIAMYPGDNATYDSVFVVTLGDDVSIDQVVSAWGNPDKIKTKGGQTIYSADELVYLIVDGDDGSGDAISFVAGSPQQVQALALRGGVSILSRPLQRLVQRTDRDRDLTLIASPRALTDRFGKTLWSTASEIIVPRLKIFFPDEVRGFSIGVHVDGGDYLELQVEHSPDVSAEALRSELAAKIGRALQEVAAFASTLRSVGYWNDVRQRIAPMTQRLVHQLRWGVEFNEVVANAWLAPDATHNLVAASELTLAFADTVERKPSVADRRKTPQTIEELLAVPRSLNIANPPDLNILMTQLADDINDDFPNMPFQLKISLMGNDLQKEGITQNQRPGPLAFDSLTLAEILTKIMVSANPNKNISGPSDQECKLVWMVVESAVDRGPADGKKIDGGESEGIRRIAVTTRAAAKARGDKLPPAFVATEP